VLTILTDLHESVIALKCLILTKEKEKPTGFHFTQLPLLSLLMGRTKVQI